MAQSAKPTIPSGGYQIKLPWQSSQSIKHKPRRFRRYHPDRPSVIVATLPRSGTHYIRGAIVNTLRYDRGRSLASGTFPKATTVPHMLTDAAKGRLCYVGHLTGSSDNMTAFKNAGINRIVLHVRDPRASLYSWSHFVRERTRLIKRYGVDVDEFLALTEVDQIDRHIDVFLPKCTTWLDGWTRALEMKDRPRILVTSHDQLAANAIDFLKAILSFYGLTARRYCLPGKTPDNYFRSGDPTEWRREMNPCQIVRMNAIIPDHLFERFGWDR